MSSKGDKKTKTAIVKDKIRDYLDKSWYDLIADIDALDPKDRVDRRMKLLEYVMPKAAAQKTEDKPPLSMAQIILSKEAVFGKNTSEKEDVDIDDL